MIAGEQSRPAIAARPRRERTPPAPYNFADWNHLIVVVGARGAGKSTWAIARALELGKAPAYLLLHDPRGAIPRQLPSGQPVGMKTVMSIAAAKTALREGQSVIALQGGPDAAAELLELAKKLAHASRTAGHRTPVVLLYDEGAIVKGLSRHRLDPAFADLTATGRWLRVGLIVTVQSARAIHYEVLSLATEIVCFRVSDQKLLARLAEVVPEEIVARLPGLPDRQCIVYRP